MSPLRDAQFYIQSEEIYDLSENDLRELNLEVAKLKELDPDIIEILLTEGRKAYSVDVFDNESKKYVGIRPTRKANKSDYFSHIERMFLREQVLGNKNYGFYIDLDIHDSPETIVKMNRDRNVIITPETAFNMAEIHLNNLISELEKNNYSFEELTKGTIEERMDMLDLVTRPFYRGDDSYFYEDKDDLSYLDMLFTQDIEDQVSRRHATGRIVPAHHYPFDGDLKMIDKIDNGDPFQRKNTIEKKKQHLRDFDHMIDLAKNRRNPTPVKQEGHHHLYTTKLYSPNYAQMKITQLVITRNKLSESLSTNHSNMS